MDLLDRLLGHDVWTTRQLATRCEELSDAELDRVFDIGHRSIRATLRHIVVNMETWSRMMAGEEPTEPDAPGRPLSVRTWTDRLEVAAAQLAAVARDVAGRGAWDERWIDVLDDPPASKTYGGAIAHVITHSMHHRAQLLYMLRQSGLAEVPEGDVFSWEHQAHD